MVHMVGILRACSNRKMILTIIPIHLSF